MATRKFLVDIDLNNNQLLNTSLQNLAAHPATAGKLPGWIYWNTAAKTSYVYTGLVSPNEWLDLGQIYAHPTFSVPGSAGNNNSLVVLESITVNSEGHVTDFKTKDISTGVRTLIINDSVTNATQTWSSTFIQAKLDAINASIVGGMINKGGYDAINNSPNLDVTPIAGIKNGWTYTVTAAATDNSTLFFSSPVAVGDMIIANQDNPTIEAHWTVVNKNIPDILPATETTAGIAEIATTAETTAGVSDSTIITPLKLEQRLASRVGGYAQDIGDGTTASYTVTHNLNTKDIVVKVYEKATDMAVETQVVPATVNTVVISFNVAPALNTYRVVVKK